MSLSRATIFRQMFESVSCTYTYLLACARTRQAIIIDPVLETVQRDVKLVQDLGLKLLYAANTHVHADHVTGSGELKRLVPGTQSVLSRLAGANADRLVEAGECLQLGDVSLEVASTPGHTNGCVTYICHSERMAFTGDALLIRGCGRTDFQQGDPGRLYDSVHGNILSLPGDYLLFPAHDYKGMTVTSVSEELKLNPRFTKPKAEFIHLMKHLGLAYPKQIDKSVPANMVCGILEMMDEKTRSEVAKTYERS